MNTEIFQKIDQILKNKSKNLNHDFDDPGSRIPLQETFQNDLQIEIKSEPVEIQQRIKSELNGLGPLDQLLEDPEITEILVNRFDQIFFEKKGMLFVSKDHFFSEASYLSALDRLSQSCHTYMNREKPFVESQFGRFRITIIFSELSRGHSLLSVRLQPTLVWKLNQLSQGAWCSTRQLEILRQIFTKHQNFLVVGGTGSGKTALLQSFLGEMTETERAVIIEDTQELHPPNAASVSLLTRQDPSQSVADVTMDDLLKRALRLRPDRIIVGEIRGPEAKSLLMALATGHDGSFGSLHARSAPEALLRLEMLVQMGAPQWSLHSIRKLMAMTVQNIFVVEKLGNQRKLAGIFKITSVEESGLTLQQLDEND